MLDNVLDDFIARAPDQLHRAKFSAMRERSIGLGAMGFHAYLQKMGVPFESMQATSANLQMFDKIKHDALEDNKEISSRKRCLPRRRFLLSKKRTLIGNCTERFF